MKRNRSGMTLIEVIVSIALLGIISVSLIGGFPSQLININKGTAITVQALEEQSNFEDIIYNVKTMIKDHNPAESLDSLVSTVPEWSYETVEVLGENIVMQKLNKSYAEVAKDNTIYLSRQLAEKEKVNKLSLTGVMIDVSTDVDDLVADLSLSPLPNLKAVHDDNTSDPNFYVNLYRWWKSNPGKDLASLVFPDDFTMINVSQTTDVLTNLLDNVGAGRFVALTVTPVDINGNRGNTMLSSNYVFVKGAEWRVGPFPWADINNDYNFVDSDDVRIAPERINKPLNASTDSIPKFLSPTEMLSIKNSSLFVPMNIEPVGGLIPGDVPVQISGEDVINWSFENSINIAKDFQVLNNSDVNITAGTDGNGGGIYFYPYVELDADGNPVYVGGFPVIINHGASISTDGNINLKTMSRGDIELLNHNQLKANSINLEARGSIQITNSTLLSNNHIVLNTKKNPEITGDRSIKLQNANFSSINPNSNIMLESEGDILFKGGGWSSNQTLYLPDNKDILFVKGDVKVQNAGIIDAGNTNKMYFQNSMIEDLARSLRIRLEKNSDNSFKLTTINYIRNVNYASPSNNQKVIMPGLWTKLGSNNQNFEFSTSVLSGNGDVKDLEYSFDNGIITVNVVTTNVRNNTKIKFDVRDRYNYEIIGSGYFVYSVDSSGNSTIVVEDPPPLNFYTITFNTNGGSEISPIEGYAGDSVGTVPDPTRTGYRFVGWDKTVPSVIPDYDLQVNAIWEPILYTITLDSNGGNYINDLKYMYGQEISIPNPSRTGHTFNGWNETPPDKMPAHDLHYVAQWTKNTLTITFDSNGGTSPNPTSKQVTYDEPYGTLAATTRSGYVFSGWYTARTNGTLITGTTLVSNPNNHILYAHWSSNSYTVYFDSNGGSNPNPSSKTIAIGSNYGALPTVTNGNRNFDGWFTDRVGGDLVTSTTLFTKTYDHTLYAQWSGGGGVSCPFVYSFDGTDYHFEHESIPFSISRALETTSYGTLRKLQSVEGIYNVRIAEELDEKSFVNGFSLYAVDYPKNSGIEYVKADIFGNPHTIADKQYPLSMEEKTTGKDVLYDVTTEGVLAGTDFRQIDSKDFMSRYEVKFNKPSRETKLGKFMITVQKSHYTTILGEYYLDKVNAQTDFWFLEKLLGLPLVENRFEDFMKVITMTVEVWDGKQWIEQGNIKAGRDLMEEFLVPIDLSLITQNTDEVIIRLSHGAGLFEIESVSMDYSINQINTVRKLKISSALLNGETDVYNDLKKHNDNKRTKMIQGDTIDLKYVAPELDENMNRGYYVALTGYYYMDPDIQEVSDMLEPGYKSIINNIKTLYDSVKGIYEDNRDTFKWLIGLMADSFKKPLDYKVELIIKSQYNEILEFIKNRE